MKEACHFCGEVDLPTIQKSYITYVSPPVDNLRILYKVLTSSNRTRVRRTTYICLPCVTFDASRIRQLREVQ